MEGKRERVASLMPFSVLTFAPESVTNLGVEEGEKKGFKGMQTDYGDSLGMIYKNIYILAFILPWLWNCHI